MAPNVPYEEQLRVAIRINNAYDITQIEYQKTNWATHMKQVSEAEARFNLVVALWGLLFTKCFLLEYLVRHYAVPINSLAYVWTLSVLMATVATVVYTNLHKNERAKLFQQPSILLIILSAIVSALFILRGLISAEQSSAYLAFAALILGVKHVGLVVRDSQINSRRMALGWLVAAGVIAYLGNPAGFLAFSISIFSLSVIPGLAQFFAHKKEKKTGAYPA